MHASVTYKPCCWGKKFSFTLSRWRERDRVRPKVALWPVDMIITFPLTAALRHPVFSNLRKAERDFILSPEGRGNFCGLFFRL